jgi:hypothetical protein
VSDDLLNELYGSMEKGPPNWIPDDLRPLTR